MRGYAVALLAAAAAAAAAFYISSRRICTCDLLAYFTKMGKMFFLRLAMMS